MDPFSLFANSSYTFLKVLHSVRGNKVVQTYPANGIVKLRDGLTQTGYTETHGERDQRSATTIHVRPNESFLQDVNLEMTGHGIRVKVNDDEYVDFRIEGQKPGIDFDTGELMFYLITLKRESYPSWENQTSPLS